MSYKQLHAKTKKRKHFIIEYEDGTKEIIKEGLLFCFKEKKDDNTIMIIKSVGLRSIEKIDFYLDSLFKFILQVLEKPERLENLKKSFEE